MAKVTTPQPAEKPPIKRRSSRQRTAIAKEPVGRYIDILTDFGFKHIFGTKEFLIDFLNAVLTFEGGIVDLHYDNTVHSGRTKDDRTAFFDLYCTLGTGELIMLEMQYKRQEFFKDRTLYYASRLIQEQGEDKKGDTTWGFELIPVYSVNIVNFTLSPSVDTDISKTSPFDKYVSYVQLFDRDTLEVFYDKLTFVFLELPYFTKGIDELSTPVDWWMYVLKNMVNLDHLPEALQNKVFEGLFLKAEIAKLSKAERKEYDRSLKKLRDMNVIIADRDRKIAALSRDIADRDSRIAERDRWIAESNRRIAESDRRVAERDSRIAERDSRIAELERQLGLDSKNKAH